MLCSSNARLTDAEPAGAASELKRSLCDDKLETEMKIEELDMSKRIDIDARDMASTLIDLENKSRELRTMAADRQREALMILREADGVETAADILRKRLGLALHGA